MQRGAAQLAIAISWMRPDLFLRRRRVRLRHWSHTYFTEAYRTIRWDRNISQRIFRASSRFCGFWARRDLEYGHLKLRAKRILRSHSQIALQCALRSARMR